MKNRLKEYIRKSLLTLLSMLLTRYSYGFTVSPMNLTLDCSSTKLSESFEIKNASEQSIIVASRIAYREINEYGNEHLREDEALKKQFFIFPRQIVLSPNERKMVRIAYKGSCQIPEEIALRVVFEQLPTSRDPIGVALDNGARVNIRLKYFVALYLKPKGAKPDLKITELSSREPINSKSGNQTYLIRIKNQGSAHELLRHFQLLGFTQSSPKPIVEFHEKDLQEFVGQNILPGAERVIELKRRAEFFRGATSVLLSSEGD